MEGKVKMWAGSERGRKKGVKGIRRKEEMGSRASCPC